MLTIFEPFNSDIVGIWKALCWVLKWSNDGFVCVIAWLGNVVKLLVLDDKRFADEVNVDNAGDERLVEVTFLSTSWALCKTRFTSYESKPRLSLFYLELKIIQTIWQTVWQMSTYF